MSRNWKKFDDLYQPAGPNNIEKEVRIRIYHLARGLFVFDGVIPIYVEEPHDNIITASVILRNEGSHVFIVK